MVVSAKKKRIRDLKNFYDHAKKYRIKALIRRNDHRSGVKTIFQKMVERRGRRKRARYAQVPWSSISKMIPQELELNVSTIGFVFSSTIKSTAHLPKSDQRSTRSEGNK